MDSGATRALKKKSIRGLSVPIWALLGSVLLHVLVLWPFGGHWRLPSWLSAKPPRLALRVLVPPAPRPRLVPVSPTPADQAQPPSPASPPTPAVKEARTPAPAPAPTPAEQPASVPSDEPDEGFVPSELLSRPASPMAEIELQNIASPEASGRLQLVLWINRSGDVVKVDVEVSEGPAWFTDQVIERFQQARFEPGLKDGEPVDSLMRIEVLF